MCVTISVTLLAYSFREGGPWWLSGKESACQCRRCWCNPWVRKIPPEKERATHSSNLAWEFQRQEPGHKELDMTEAT